MFSHHDTEHRFWSDLKQLLQPICNKCIFCFTLIGANHGLVHFCAQSIASMSLKAYRFDSPWSKKIGHTIDTSLKAQGWYEKIVSNELNSSPSAWVRADQPSQSFSSNHLRCWSKDTYQQDWCSIRPSLRCWVFSVNFIWPFSYISVAQHPKQAQLVFQVHNQPYRLPLQVQGPLHLSYIGSEPTFISYTSCYLWTWGAFARVMINLFPTALLPKMKMLRSGQSWTLEYQRYCLHAHHRWEHS